MGIKDKKTTWMEIGKGVNHTSKNLNALQDLYGTLSVKYMEAVQNGDMHSAEMIEAKLDKLSDIGQLLVNEGGDYIDETSEIIADQSEDIVRKLAAAFGIEYDQSETDRLFQEELEKIKGSTSVDVNNATESYNQEEMFQEEIANVESIIGKKLNISDGHDAVVFGWLREVDDLMTEYSKLRSEGKYKESDNVLAKVFKIIGGDLQEENTNIEDNSQNEGKFVGGAKKLISKIKSRVIAIFKKENKQTKDDKKNKNETDILDDSGIEKEFLEDSKIIDETYRKGDMTTLERKIKYLDPKLIAYESKLDDQWVKGERQCDESITELEDTLGETLDGFMSALEGFDLNGDTLSFDD